MSTYWEDRAVWDLYQNMDDAEAVAALIARVYRRASMQLVFDAQDLFEKYMTKHKLSGCWMRCRIRILWMSCYRF